MKALFIGGTGIISAAVSRRAVEQGIDLTLLNRGRRGEFFPRGARQVVADRQDARAVKEALRGQSFDIVADWIALITIGSTAVTRSPVKSCSCTRTVTRASRSPSSARASRTG